MIAVVEKEKIDAITKLPKTNATKMENYIGADYDKAKRKVISFVISVNCLSHMIKDYFGDGEKMGVI